MKHLFVLLFLLCALRPVTAAAPPTLILILLPGTSLQDWQSADAPNLHHLMQTGALAVMNTRSAHQAGQKDGETPQSVLLTLGAGSRAAGTNATSCFSPVSEWVPALSLSAGTLFERRTGLRPLSGRRVCLDWPAVVQANRNSGYDLHLGSLADTLTAHGFEMEAGGGPDADWIAAGGDGTVRHVSVLAAEPGCCLIWDAGPSPATADTVIGSAQALAAKQHARLIVLSPYPSQADERKNRRLTPVLVWGTDVPHGFLASPSTRRSGLVTDTDFAPAVADYFGINRTKLASLPFGFVWSVLPALEPAQAAEQLSSEAVRQADGMRGMPYLAAASGVWLLVLTLLPAARRDAGSWGLVPYTALIAALFAVSVMSLGLVFFGLMAVNLALTRIYGLERSVTVFAAATTLALATDMLTGNRLMHRSLLGYSAIEGARYYGIGNEAMGLLLGTSLLAVWRLWSHDRYRRFALITCLVSLTLLLGSVGAKAGGVLVSLAVYGAFVYTASGHRWSARSAAVLAGIVASGLAIAALGDAFLLTHGHSHLGEAVRRIESGGLGEAGDIVVRKLIVEGRLATHSAWALLLWAGVFCLGVLWKRIPPRTKAESALRLSGVVGVLTCLLFNDAGVVAAAILIVCLWTVSVRQTKNLSAPECSEAERLEA